MTPERAYAIGLRIAAMVMDTIDDDAPPTAARMSELVHDAAKRLGCTDDDASTLISEWSRVMAKLAELRASVIDEESATLLRNVRHFRERGRMSDVGSR